MAETNENAEQNESANQNEKSERKRPGKKPLIILGIVVVIMVIVALVWWLLTRNEETTDDAFTDADVVTIAPKAAGYVTELRVRDNQRVKKGDLLVVIDPRDTTAQRDQAQAQLGLAVAQLHQAQAQLALSKVQYPAQRDEAKAQVLKAQADMANAQAEYRRQRGVDPRATTQQSIDSANAQLRSAQAGLAEVRAPFDGFVTKRNVQPGTLVQAGTALFSLVSPDIWVVANFKESQLERMRPGNKVAITVDAWPDMKLEGHIDSIQQGSGARFSAFPAENATGNFVKIVQRVPVKIVIDKGLDPNMPLPLGLSVEPKVTLE
jgi:membrane fusion protein (multidrug efflux system)